MALPTIVPACSWFAQVVPPRGFQIPAWGAALLLVALVAVAIFLWKLLRDD